LQHIIAQIDGCATVGETHLRYRKPRDLSRLIRRVCEESGLSYFRRRTFLDKITADNHVILNYYRGRLTNMVHQAEQLRHRNRGFF
jgi:hypothetical protein